MRCHDCGGPPEVQYLNHDATNSKEMCRRCMARRLAAFFLEAGASPANMAPLFSLVLPLPSLN